MKKTVTSLLFLFWLMGILATFFVVQKPDFLQVAKGLVYLSLALSVPLLMLILSACIGSILLPNEQPIERLILGSAIGMGALRLMAARNVHLYGVVAPFVLAETVHGLTRLKGVRAIESVLKNVEGQVKSALWPVVTVILFGALILGTKVRNIYAFDPAFFPVDAVTWLESHPQEGRMFNDLNWGGYIAWKLWPEQKVFVDSMADVTGEITLEYETALTMSEGWEEIFSKYQIEWVILPADSKLMRALGNNPAWEILYTNSTAAILRQK